MDNHSNIKKAYNWK